MAQVRACLSTVTCQYAGLRVCLGIGPLGLIDWGLRRLGLVRLMVQASGIMAFVKGP